MRVIAGKHRGRKLKSPRGAELRPTGDRLKETLFNILAPRVGGAVVLDVFAGSGAIGIEAISRGAREVVFIEAGIFACRLIRANLELCGIAAGYRVLQGEAFRTLRSLGREGFGADIIYLDPPYDWEPYKDLLEVIFGGGLAAGESCVIVEHHRAADLPDEGDGYRLFRKVRQGNQCLSFYSEPPGAPGNGETAEV